MRWGKFCVAHVWYDTVVQAKLMHKPYITCIIKTLSWYLLSAHIYLYEKRFSLKWLCGYQYCNKRFSYQACLRINIEIGDVLALSQGNPRKCWHYVDRNIICYICWKSKKNYCQMSNLQSMHQKTNVNQVF